jgi:hypothetical protein
VKIVTGEEQNDIIEVLVESMMGKFAYDTKARPEPDPVLQEFRNKAEAVYQRSSHCKITTYNELDKLLKERDEAMRASKSLAAH